MAKNNCSAAGKNARSYYCLSYIDMFSHSSNQANLIK